MHHSVIFNQKRNEYFVTFDWDANYDGTADHVYALRLNQAARIVDKSVLNITANLPGWIGGKDSLLLLPKYENTSKSSLPSSSLLQWSKLL